jgi:nicotinate-nucleotide--dimethylbenzimidazole phosphoribosyltransferase
MEWLKQAISPPSSQACEEALKRQGQLTKPRGSLGCLEELVVRLAAMQRTLDPRLERIWISVFAADHGVANEGVSAFPQSVTCEMVRNFANGGAAINVLVREVGANLEIVDVGTAQPLPELRGVISRRVGCGTRNFVKSEAMTESQLSMALQAGREASKRALAQGCDLYIGGEMGIANTTSASALACTLLEAAPEHMVGPGTGLDAQGIAHKCEVVKVALARHPPAKADALSALRCLGGFEIAALTGAYLYCAQHGLPVLIDGFITTVAASLAVRIQLQAADWFIYAHRSQEPGHQLLLKALNAEPLLDLSMRLGEGSGAALAIPILRAACALHREMATFEQARVSPSTSCKTPSPPWGEGRGEGENENHHDRFAPPW